MTKRFQQIMDEAYTKYPEKGSWIDFVSSLTETEQMAVVLGKLNYQVCNGGFHQWRDNGYGCNEGILLAKMFLRKLGTPAADKVGTIIATASMGFAPEGEDEPFTPWYEEDPEEELWDFDLLSRCDDDFYEVNDQLLQDCEKFFAGQDKAELSVGCRIRLNSDILWDGTGEIIGVAWEHPGTKGWIVLLDKPDPHNAWKGICVDSSCLSPA